MDSLRIRHFCRFIQFAISRTFPSVTEWAAISPLLFAMAGVFSSSIAHAAEPPSASELAQLIDARISERWESEGITPAPLADDAEYLRRVYLDICGKIPHASTVRDFLEDESPDKRRAIVEELLSGPSYIIHYTNLWRAAMIPEAEADPQIRFALPGFESWLRSRIAENRNFAEIVEEMLTLPVDRESMIAFRQPERPTPAAFYQAKQAKPEELAAATSRLFLGLRIDCAQCHDHPFDNWKQEQFWKHAAFFTDISSAANNVSETATEETEPGTIRIPDKNSTVSAMFLDGTIPAGEVQNRNRTALAEWIVSDENPYFAKAAVNRIWSYHFGIGLVEPMDDFSPNNPASHPELIEELSQAFIASNFDFKLMIRAITASRTYQLSSRQTDESQSERTTFARMAVKGMSAEQIFDSLAVATGYRQPFDPEQPLNFNNDQARQEFLGMFGNQTEAPLDRSSTVLQALTLMNGDFVGNATDLGDSRTLTAIIDAPFLNNAEKIQSMYLTTLNRPATDEEQKHLQDYLSQAVDSAEVQEHFTDIFWALLNSSEFLLNH